MTLDRKSANARRDLQHGHSLATFIQKREIFETFTHKRKAFEGHLSTSTNRSRVHVWPVLSSSFYFQWFG